MFFKQFYLACLAHASYLIGSNGEACVVDPQRDIDEYLTEAKNNGLTIKYIFETHLHADFVSGHKELAEATGAKIVFSDQANARFDHEAVADGTEFKLGEITIKVLATPGHTPESICLLVSDKQGTPVKILTGDTLFIGDVGRPDLVGKCGFDSKQMAAMLYDSLHQKILTLPDSTEVYPAHGAGSLCGKNISSESFSTIGNQRKFNYALQAMTKEQFVEMVTAQLPEVPAYFPLAVEANRSGAASLGNLQKARAMTAQDVEAALKTTAIGPATIILDTRSPAEFGQGHIPGAYSVGLGGQFASWCGTVISAKSRIILVLAEDNQVDEAVLRLARAGLENVVAYLAGGMEAWQQAGLKIETVEQISVQELADKLAADPELRVLDVRRPGEYSSGHVPQAKNISLAELEKQIEAVERGVKTAIICAGGYRSSMAASLLKRHGIDELFNVSGGTSAWVKAKLPVLTEAPTACSAS